MSKKGRMFIKKFEECEHFSIFGNDYRMFIPIADGLFNYDSYIYPPIGCYDFLPHSEEELRKAVEFNEYIGKCAVGVGRGANFPTHLIVQGT